MKGPGKDDGVSKINAHPFKRLGAFLIDFIIFKVLIYVLLSLSVLFTPLTPRTALRITVFRTNIYEHPYFFLEFKDLLIHVALSTIFIGYFTVFESRYIWGATPGKRILKVKVIKIDGSMVGLIDSLKRNITKEILRLPWIGIPFGFIELALVFFFSQRTGDFLADTRVISGIHKGRFSQVKRGP